MAEPLVAPELVTPPLGLVALLGRPELHPALREHLRSQLRPPLESVGVGDLAEATSVLTRRKRNGPSAAPPAAPVNPLIPPVAPGGIGPAQIPAQGATEGSGSSNPSDGTDAPRRGVLRADWTRKHRERRPAVALAFLPHEEVEGDPNAWVSLTRRIDALRDAAAGAGCALALVVVGDDAPERLPEDRVAALTRQAKIDRSALVSMPQPPTPDAMRAVGALCANLAKAYYVGECARHAAETLPGGGIEAAEPGMKDCARHAKSNSEYLEICLEIAALGGTSASDAVAAMAAAQAAMEDADGTEVTIGMGTTPRSGHTGPGGDDHPLARAVHCVAGFGASHAVPGESIELTVAVRSCLPATLPVKSVAAVFGDGMYDWTSEDAVSELPARTWRVFVVKVTPAWGHPVNVVALVLTLANGVRFRLELGDGNGESPGRRGWLAPDERLPAAFNSGCNLGVHSLDLRAAPLKMSLSVNVDGPALLGEVTALPLVVVSTGDGLDDATLVLTVKEGDKYLGSTQENGGIRSEEASAPGPDVVLLRAPDSQSAMQPREPIAIGNVPPRWHVAREGLRAVAQARTPRHARDGAPRRSLGVAG